MMIERADGVSPLICFDDDGGDGGDGGDGAEGGDGETAARVMTLALTAEKATMPVKMAVMMLAKAMKEMTVLAKMVVTGVKMKAPLMVQQATIMPTLKPIMSLVAEAA